jgi:NADPH:quinone reductase-like Zn-dependent oxidoreductase/acyl carrier protein
MRAAVASLHAGGCVVDWGRVLPQGGRVVPLPPYAWQRQRYWAEVGDYRPRTTSTAAALHAGAEFPGRELRSLRLSGTVIEAWVSTESPTFVADHRVHDRVLFPAAAFLMMAATGLARANAGVGASLKQVTIIEPLVLDPGVARQLQLLVDEKDGARSVTVASLADETTNRWRTHVTAEALVTNSLGTAGRLDDEALAAIRARCTETIDSASWYDDLRAAGFAFGNTFRTIHGIARREGEAIAEVELPNGLVAAGCAIHPVVVDGCVQAMWAAFPDRIRLATPRPAYVPVSFGAFEIHRAAPARVRSHVTIVSVGENDQTITAHIRVYAETGELVLSADDVLVRRASREAIIRRTEQSANEWMYELLWTEAPRLSRATPSSQTSPGVWILLPDGHGVAARVDAILQSRGSFVVRAETVDGLARVFEAARALGELRGVLDCRALDVSAVDTAAVVETQLQSLGGALSLVQTMVKGGHVPSRGLTFVTRGAQPVEDDVDRSGLMQAPLWGFARTIAIEHPELQLRCIDLEAAATEGEGETLAAELHDSADGENQLAFRRGVRYTARLVRAAQTVRNPHLTPLRLEIPQRGTLEKLTLQPLTRRTPAAGEVEIAVEASGVNFRDVLNALGMYPGDAGLLGSECVGRVVATGPGVDRFAVGDRVVAVGDGCLGTHTTTRAEFVALCPENLPSDAAATLPITFMTARYALENLAKIRPGDRVLIHAAAGGVGLAAVQIVQRAGGEVFATAGSADKHAYLRSLGVRHVMSSRTLDFAEQISALTEGRGVDIVLNSLAGDFIERTLSVLATNGRFIEIGKTGIWNAETVAQKRPDVAYHTLYLGEVIERDPAVGRALLQGVVDDVATGRFQPLPLRAFPIDAAVRAFRFMAQARHIGKIVLTVPTGVSARTIVPDATYLITGGLGALGLVVAEALAAAGARHLVLVGRSAPSATALERITALRSRGTDIAIVPADISRSPDVAALLAALPSGYPLRGIIHAAGVIDDGMVMQQSWERFSRVLAPKLCGAWLLHQATAALPLDFFVMFSSVASVLGSPGQSGYSAANAFMDALSHVRRAQGLPALSINWGAWVDGGMASALAEADRRRWTNQGVEAIEPARGREVLLDLLAGSRPQITVLPISWATYGQSSAGRSPSSLVADLVRAAAQEPGAAAAGNEPTDVRARLEAVAPARRRAVLVSFVTEQAVKVLGLPSTYVLDAQRGLRDVGLDSLMAIELRNRLQETTGQPLPATLAFDCPTVAALTDYLSTRVLQALFSEPAAAVSIDAGLQEIEGLSDGEAEELLRQELALLNGRERRAT